MVSLLSSRNLRSKAVAVVSITGLRIRFYISGKGGLTRLIEKFKGFDMGAGRGKDSRTNKYIRQVSRPIKLTKANDLFKGNARSI